MIYGLATNWLIDTPNTFTQEIRVSPIHTYIYTEEKGRDWTIKQPKDIREAMELAEGGTLRDMLRSERGGALTDYKRLQMVSQIAAAERWFARQALPHRRRQAVDVLRCLRLLASQLLRRHVRECA